MRVEAVVMESNLVVSDNCWLSNVFSIILSLDVLTNVASP